MPDIQITTHYPRSDEWEYSTELERIQLDKERINDIYNGKGFVITSSKPIKDDIKDPDGIFSSKFGMTLQDVQAYATRYKCKCGYLISRFMLNQTCPICGTPVRHVDDDFGYFGWVVLKDPYYTIHPTMFMSLSSFIGAEVFDNIIKINVKKDEDGNDMETKKPKGEPYYGIGMMAFHDRFDEIMGFYAMKHKSPGKRELYEDIMANKHIVFTQSIPVFTTLLRPYKVEADDLHFEKTNATYKIITTIAERINRDKLRMTKKAKSKNALLYDLQMKVKELHAEILAILSGKKGTIRQLYGVI